MWTASAARAVERGVLPWICAENPVPTAETTPRRRYTRRAGDTHDPESLLQCQKKAPAVTLPQVVLVLATVLPLREFDPQWALDILASHQQRNHAASFSHRKRRIALVPQRE